jgi:uncharacterized protein (DUF1697 family)
MRAHEGSVCYEETLMGGRRIALLRGINVGGNKMVAMADLRALVTRLGFGDVQSVLQSGNLAFSVRGAGRSCATLETLLEREVEKALKVKADFHVRTDDEWKAVIEGNPFRAEAARDPGHLLVSFFKAPLVAANVAALRAAITGPEVLHADGRHLYMVFPEGMGRSKAAPLIDKKLAALGTARNWNTVMKLSALSGV